MKLDEIFLRDIPNDIPDPDNQTDSEKSVSDNPKPDKYYKEIQLPNNVILHIKDPEFYDKMKSDPEFQNKLNSFGNIWEDNNKHIADLNQKTNNQFSDLLSGDRANFKDFDLDKKLQSEINLSGKILSLYDNFYKENSLIPDIEVSAPGPEKPDNNPIDYTNPKDIQRVIGNTYRINTDVFNSNLKDLYPILKDVESGKIQVPDAVKSGGDESILKYLGKIKSDDFENIFYQNINMPAGTIVRGLSNVAKEISNKLFNTDFKTVELPKYTSGNDLLDFVSSLPVDLLLLKGSTSLVEKPLSYIFKNPTVLNALSDATGFVLKNTPKNLSNLVTGDISPLDYISNTMSEALTGGAFGLNPGKTFSGRMFYNALVPTFAGQLPNAVLNKNLDFKNLLEGSIQQVALDLVLGGSGALKMANLKREFNDTKQILQNAFSDPITGKKIVKYLDFAPDYAGAQRNQSFNEFLDQVDNTLKEVGNNRLTPEWNSKFTKLAEEHGINIERVPELKDEQGQDVRGLIKTDIGDDGNVNYTMILNSDKVTNNTIPHEITHKVIDFNQFSRAYNNILSNLGTEEIVAEGMANSLVKKGIDPGIKETVIDGIKNTFAKIRYSLGSDDLMTSWRIFEDAVIKNKTLDQMTPEKFKENVSKFGLDKYLDKSVESFMRGENMKYTPDAQNVKFVRSQQYYDPNKINQSLSSSEIEEKYPNVKFYDNSTYHVDKDILDKINRLNPEVFPIFSRLPNVEETNGLLEYKGKDFQKDFISFLTVNNNQNFHQLFDIYKSEFGNVLDVDNARLMLNKFGYDFHDIYSDKNRISEKLNYTFYNQMLKDSVYRKVSFVGGVPGTGKSYFVNDINNNRELIVSSPMLNLGVVEKQLKAFFNSTHTFHERGTKMYFVVNDPLIIADNIIRRMNTEQRIVPFHVLAASFTTLRDNFRELNRPYSNEFNSLFENYWNPDIFLAVSNQWKQNPDSGRILRYSELFWKESGKSYDFNDKVKLFNFTNYVRELSENKLIHPEIRNEYVSQIGEFTRYNFPGHADIRYQTKAEYSGTRKNNPVLGKLTDKRVESGIGKIDELLYDTSKLRTARRSYDRLANSKDLQGRYIGVFDPYRRILDKSQISLDNLNHFLNTSKIVNNGKAVSLESIFSGFDDYLNKEISTFHELTPADLLFYLKKSDYLNNNSLVSLDKVVNDFESFFHYKFDNDETLKSATRYQKIDFGDFKLPEFKEKEFTNLTHEFDGPDGHKYELRFDKRYMQFPLYDIQIFDKTDPNNRKSVGYYNFMSAYENAKNVLKANFINTNPEYQRKGFAESVYDFMNNAGYDIIPSSIQMDSSFKFWLKRAVDKYNEGDSKYLAKLFQDVYWTDNQLYSGRRNAVIEKSELSEKELADIVSKFDFKERDYDIHPFELGQSIDESYEHRKYSAYEDEMYDFFDSAYSNDVTADSRYQSLLDPTKKFKPEFRDITSDDLFPETDKSDNFELLSSAMFKAKDGKDYIISMNDNKYNDGYLISVYKADNKSLPVGEVEFRINPGSKILHAESLSVDTEFKRLGLATSIYDYAESQGFKILPSRLITEQGFKFWYDRGLEKYYEGDKSYLAKLLLDYSSFYNKFSDSEKRVSNSLNENQIEKFSRELFNAKQTFIEETKKLNDQELNSLLNDFDYIVGDYESLKPKDNRSFLRYQEALPEDKKDVQDKSFAIPDYYDNHIKESTLKDFYAENLQGKGFSGPVKLMHTLYQYLLDAGHSLKWSVDKLHKAGIEIEDGKNPYLQFSLYPSIVQYADAWINKKPFIYDNAGNAVEMGKSLKEILDPLNELLSKDRKDNYASLLETIFEDGNVLESLKSDPQKLLEMYLTNKSALERYNQGQAQNINPEMSKFLIDSVEKHFPEIPAAAKDIYEFSKNVLKLQVDLLGSDVVNTMIEKYDYYSPLERVFEDKKIIDNFLPSKRFSEVRSKVKSAKGSADFTYASPLATLVKNVYLSLDTYVKNKISMDTIDMLMKSEEKPELILDDNSIVIDIKENPYEKFIGSLDKIKEENKTLYNARTIAIDDINRQKKDLFDSIRKKKSAILQEVKKGWNRFKVEKELNETARKKIWDDFQAELKKLEMARENLWRLNNQGLANYHADKLEINEKNEKVYKEYDQKRNDIDKKITDSYKKAKEDADKLYKSMDLLDSELKTESEKFNKQIDDIRKKYEIDSSNLNIRKSEILTKYEVEKSKPRVTVKSGKAKEIETAHNQIIDELDKGRLSVFEKYKSSVEAVESKMNDLKNNYDSTVKDLNDKLEFLTRDYESKKSQVDESRKSEVDLYLKRKNTLEYPEKNKAYDDFKSGIENVKIQSNLLYDEYQDSRNLIKRQKEDLWNNFIEFNNQHRSTKSDLFDTLKRDLADITKQKNDEWIRFKELSHEIKQKRYEKLSEIKLNKDGDILTYSQDGKVFAYRVDKDIAKSLGVLRNYEPLKFAEKILHKSAEITKDLTALSPTFIARNLTMDQWNAWVNEGAVPFLNAVHGWMHILSNSEEYQKYKQLGGPMSTLISANTNKMKEYQEIFNHSTYKQEMAKWINPIHILKFIGETIEQGNKVGIFVGNLKSKEVMSDLMNVFKSRGSTVDFSRMGSSRSMINTINGLLVPFFNARLQGFDRIMRTMNESFNPLSINWTPGKMLRGFSTVAPLVITSLIFKNMNEKDDKFKEISQTEKDVYWYIPRAITGTNYFIKIPKGDAGFLFGSIPEILYDNRLISSFGSILDNLSPTGELMSFPVNPLVSVGVGQLAGYDFFQRKYFKEMEDNPFNTDSYHFLFKTIADKTGIPVERVRHVISGFTVGFGLDALSMFDLITNDKFRQVAGDPGRSIIFKRYVSSEYSQSVSQQKFNEMYNQSKKVFWDVAQFLNRNDIAAAEKYLESGDNYKSFYQYPVLNQFAKKIDDIRDKDYSIKNDQNLSPKEKLQKLILENENKKNISKTAINEVVNVPISKLNLFEDLSSRVYGIPFHFSKEDKEKGNFNLAEIEHFINRYEYQAYTSKTNTNEYSEERLLKIKEFKTFVQSFKNKNWFK
jgi:hypothetical protein